MTNFILLRPSVLLSLLLMDLGRCEGNPVTCLLSHLHLLCSSTQTPQGWQPLPSSVVPQDWAPGHSCGAWSCDWAGQFPLLFPKHTLCASSSCAACVKLWNFPKRAGLVFCCLPWAHLLLWHWVVNHYSREPNFAPPVFYKQWGWGALALPPSSSPFLVAAASSQAMGWSFQQFIWC